MHGAILAQLTVKGIAYFLGKHEYFMTPRHVPSVEVFGQKAVLR
jgi:hypothetical protein